MLRSKFVLLCLVCFLGAFLLVTMMLVKRELWSRNVVNPRHVVHTLMPKYIPKKFTKFTQKMTEISLRCKKVCSERAGGICVPLDLAIFIYRKDIPTRLHTYVRSHPVIHLPLTDATKKLPKTMAVNECLVEEYFPDVELIPQQGSCAIVGNSGILLKSGCGQAIDSHDYVIRANFAPMTGFETDVGYKANLSAFNTETLFRFSASIIENPGPDYVQYQDVRYRDQYLNHVHNLNESAIWYLKHLRPPHDEMFRNITKEIRNFNNSQTRIAYSWMPIRIEKSWSLPKTGTLGFDMFAVARTFCSRISLYGFYPFQKDLKGNRIPHHYYEELPEFKYQSEVHNFNVEYQHLKELDANGDLKLVVGACKPKSKNHLKT